MANVGFLQVNAVSKVFRHYPSPAARLKEWFTGRACHVERTILDNISFNVRPGEAVGIVGRNGAGKSTILKLITGTLSPSQGDIRLSGRVSALLELGMGFHTEYTGRENAVMACHLQGLSSEEAMAHMADIESFAEIGEYFEQPLRTYSSGMQVRLAFSVATTLRPDILIVDEALSVGDAYFQHKCAERIRHFKKMGTTLLFVSHDPLAIRSLCDRAILLEGGRVVIDGSPDDVLDRYNALIALRQDQELKDIAASHQGMRSGNGQVRIDRVDLSVAGTRVMALRQGEPAILRISYTAHDDIDDLTIGISIRDRLGNEVFGTNSWHHSLELAPLVAGRIHFIEFVFPQLLLGLGSFSVSVAAHTSHSHLTTNYDWWDRALVFEVVSGSLPAGVGCACLPVALRTTADPAHDGGVT